MSIRSDAFSIFESHRIFFGKCVERTSKSGIEILRIHSLFIFDLVCFFERPNKGNVLTLELIERNRNAFINPLLLYMFAYAAKMFALCSTEWFIFSIYIVFPIWLDLLYAGRWVGSNKIWTDRLGFNIQRTFCAVWVFAHSQTQRIEKIDITYTYCMYLYCKQGFRQRKSLSVNLIAKSDTVWMIIHCMNDNDLFFGKRTNDFVFPRIWNFCHVHKEAIESLLDTWTERRRSRRQ